MLQRPGGLVKNGDRNENRSDARDALAVTQVVVIRTGQPALELVPRSRGPAPMPVNPAAHCLRNYHGDHKRPAIDRPAALRVTKLVACVPLFGKGLNTVSLRR
jgi:hypothetical protein